jgi:hypothetical protein
LARPDLERQRQRPCLDEHRQLPRRRGRRVRDPALWESGAPGGSARRHSRERREGEPVDGTHEDRRSVLPLRGSRSGGASRSRDGPPAPRGARDLAAVVRRLRGTPGPHLASPIPPGRQGRGMSAPMLRRLVEHAESYGVAPAPLHGMQQSRSQPSRYRLQAEGAVRVSPAADDGAVSGRLGRSRRARPRRHPREVGRAHAQGGLRVARSGGVR